MESVNEIKKLESQVKQLGFYRVQHQVKTLNPDEFFEAWKKRDEQEMLSMIQNPAFVITGAKCPFPWVNFAYEKQPGRWVCPGCPAEHLRCYRWEVPAELLQNPTEHVSVAQFLQDIGMPEVLHKYYRTLEFEFIQVLERKEAYLLERLRPVGPVDLSSDETVTVPVRFLGYVTLRPGQRTLKDGKIALPTSLFKHSNLVDKAGAVLIGKYEDLVEVFKGFHSYLAEKGFRLHPKVLTVDWLDHLFPGRRKQPCAYREGDDCTGCEIGATGECESAFYRFREREWRNFIQKVNSALPTEWRFYEEFVLCYELFPTRFSIDENRAFSNYIDNLIRLEKLRQIQEGEFTFDVEACLEQLKQDWDWRDKVLAYEMYRRGRFQDDIAKQFGVTQSAISKWIKAVKGEVARQMGAAYEHFLKQKLQLRSDIRQVVHDGRQGQPDFTVWLKNGAVEVIAAKCILSERKTVSMKIKEIEPELQQALKLKAQGHQVRLIVDYYNPATKHHEQREINPENPPPRLLFETT